MFGNNNEYNEVERAYCYGIYRVNMLSNDTPADKDYLHTADKICMKKKADDWPNFFLGTQKGDKYCVDLPNSYMKFDENNIGPITKFVDFSDDGFAYKTKYKPEQKLNGKCDAIFGLEEEKVINTNAIKQGELSDIELNHLKDKISAIEENLNKNNANLSGLTKAQLTILGYSVEAMQGDSLGPPTRQLNGNVPIGNIAHGCRFVSGDDGCGENTETTEFLGYATFKLPDNKYQTGYVPETKNVDFEVDTANNLKTMKLEVSGSCAKGYRKIDDSSFPKRICKVILDSATNKVVTKAWEGRTIENACVPE
jgi:sporulation protein YlmC with PRC-barrel domain